MIAPSPIFLQTNASEYGLNAALIQHLQAQFPQYVMQKLFFSDNGPPFSEPFF